MGKNCPACNEYSDDAYMVYDHVWTAAGFSYLAGWAHLRCLESRLGRPMSFDDFTGVPLNFELGKRFPHIVHGDKLALAKRLLGDYENKPWLVNHPLFKNVNLTDFVDGFSRGPNETADS